MAKSTLAIATSLREQLDKLASFEPQELPVLSLYLNLAPTATAVIIADASLPEPYGGVAASLRFRV